MMTDYGVVGMDCVAMVKNLKKFRRFEFGEGERFPEEEDAKTFRFKTTLLSPILSEILLEI
jgi:hypothetical protein